MAGQRVTMKDVAKAAGVTTAAVSYAISGKRPISDETRKRVEQAIKELGYAPNMAARTLSSASRGGMAEYQGKYLSVQHQGLRPQRND